MMPHREEAIGLQASHGGAKMMPFGGEAMGRKRQIRWNLTSFLKERMEKMKTEGKIGHFDIDPGDAAEFVSPAE